MTPSTTLSTWLGIRPDERRDVGFGFAVLLLFLVGHGLLENARDTLFLSELPIRRLPWAYITIAVLALLVGAVVNRRPLATARGRALAPVLLGVALVDVAFFALIAERDPRALFALYVWTGVAASLVTLQFWLRAGDVFDVGRAKRLFGVIAAGGLLGATIGAALAAFLVRALSPRALVLVSAFCAVAAACVERSWHARSPGHPHETAGGERAEEPLRFDAYLWMLLGLVLVGSIVATGVDYLFKAVVAQEIPRARIGHFLAQFFLVVNAAALVFQVFVTPRLLQGLGVVGSAAGLPLFMLAGTGAAAAVGGLAPVLLAKASDGTLRHSLDRAATEILHLPVGDGIRDRVKAITTAVGQRGGQAIASVALLLVTAAGASTRELAAGLAGLSALWCAVAVALRTGYLERFRIQLRTAGRGFRGVLPPLDVAALESLVGALRSSDDAEVLAAIDVLEAYEKPHLVSPLLVHHPSPAVALRVLDLFADSSDADALRLVEHVLPEDDGEVRAALLRVRTARAPDEALLRRHLRDTRSPAVRCTALVGLVAGGFVEDREAERMLREVLTHVTPDACSTVARALQDLPPRFARTLAELARNPDPRFATEVAKAIAGDPHPVFLETLIDALAHRDARPHARAALVALGDVALTELAGVLADSDVPPAIRLHVPRTLSRFGTADAAALLADRLTREDDDRVRYKILRALGRMRTDEPELPVPVEVLGSAAEAFLARAVALLAHRVAVERLGLTRAPGSLLRRLLEEEERRAVECVFRVLHVLEPGEGYANVCVGLTAQDGALRAGGRELLEHILSGPLRAGLLALTDGLPPSAQLEAALSVHEPPGARALLALATEDPRDAPAAERLAADARAALRVDPSPLVRALAEIELAPEPTTRAHGA